MRKGIVFSLFIVCLMLLAAGCPKDSNSSQPASGQVATNSNASPVPLPDDWPIPELTLPPGATLTGLVQDPLDVDFENQEGTWMVDVDYSQGWKALGNHVENCLKPLNYSEFWLDNPRIADPRGSQREFYSPDRLTEVVLQNHEGLPANFPGQGIGNYVIMIRKWTKPDPVLKFAGRTSSKGVTAYLVPIK